MFTGMLQLVMRSLLHGDNMNYGQGFALGIFMSRERFFAVCTAHFQRFAKKIFYLIQYVNGVALLKVFVPKLAFLTFSERLFLSLEQFSCLKTQL